MARLSPRPVDDFDPAATKTLGPRAVADPAGLGLLPVIARRR